MTESPTYTVLVALNEISFVNEYPKNKDKFIWGLPSKYEDFRDREISAFCSCWICDFTKQSFKAAHRLDKIMQGSPYKFVWNREFDYFIMNVEQKETLYGGIKMSDVYYMFDKLHKLIRRYSSIKGAFSCYKKDIPYDEALAVLSDFRQFNGKSIDSVGRINLFLFMMTHCYNDYDYDSSMLQPPLFNNRILATCRRFRFVDMNTKRKDLIPYVTQNLKWISKKNPLTYWVGIATYRDYVDENPKKVKKFISMRLIRHPYKKR